MKRRLLASLSVLFILSSINAQVFAADSSLQEITFNEYYSAIQDRFESYGIRWEGVSTNNLYPDYVYTQEDLNEALEHLMNIVRLFCLRPKRLSVSTQ